MEFEGCRSINGAGAHRVMSMTVCFASSTPRIVQTNLVGERGDWLDGPRLWAQIQAQIRHQSRLHLQHSTMAWSNAPAPACVCTPLRQLAADPYTPGRVATTVPCRAPLTWYRVRSFSQVWMPDSASPGRSHPSWPPPLVVNLLVVKLFVGFCMEATNVA